MILYALACHNGHRFESWFRNSEGYDAQAARGLIACPTCNATQVSKTIMAPAIVSRAAPIAETRAPQPAPAPATPALLDDRQAEVRAALKAIRERILSEGEDVGTLFSDQARKMHDGEIPQRPIHGQTTLDEARALIEDGVPVLPMPVIPEELN